MSTGPRVRCTVTSMSYSPCDMRVGDSFEVGRDGLRIPDDGGFCYNAIASALSLLNGRFGDDRDEWLATRPLIACPDPPECLHMRLELVEDKTED